MKDLTELDKYRIRSEEIMDYFGSFGNADEGCFRFRYQGNKRNELQVIACAAEGWDHVSVSLKKRLPTYKEMRFIKNLFFRADETALEYHVPETDHINIHDYCLHLWRPHDLEIPMPPKGFV